METVKEFIYLGVKLEERGGEAGEVKVRVAKGKQVYGKLSKLMRAKVVSRKTKERIYKSIIRPTVMYESETWVLNGAEEEALGRWESSIYGGVESTEGWRT